MAELSQNDRLLKVKTALGPDKFLLRQLSVTEVLEQPFVMHGELVVANPDETVEANDLLGKAITCTVEWPERGVTRHFTGVVCGFGATGTLNRGFRTYRFEAVPSLWLLSRAMDCRIFQKKSVKDIVQQVVQERQAGTVTFTHMPSGDREYCTQFNETDLDFVQRLLDESGCTYFFSHTESSEGCTVTGESAGFPTLAGDPMVVRGEADRPDAVTGWTALTVLQPGKHKAWDFDNLTPSQLKQAEAPTTLTLPNGLASKLQMYRWPGGQAVRPDATDGTAKMRMQRHEAEAEVWSGHSGNGMLSPGHKVSIQVGVEGSATPWLLTSVTHDVFDDTHLATQGGSGYQNSFTAIAGSRIWRGPGRRQRPVIPGLQSAIVTGPSGEEIHCDKHGRVKLHFLWDHRDDKKNDQSSCYVRVAQPFGGAWGGSWFLPRIGDEVLVSFLDGDPDRPVVVGSLYNADGPPPWALPAHNTRSGIRSRSTKGGGRSNANMVGFDDKKGSEQLYLQAEKDMLNLVKNQKKTTVKGNEIRDVTGESTDQPDGKRTTTVKGDESLTIKQGNEIREIKMGNRDTTLGMGNDTLELKMGNLTIKCALGAIDIEAMQSITLHVGQSKIVVDQLGVKVEGMMIDVKGTLMTTVDGLMHNGKASAMLTEKAPLIMIGP